MAGAVVITLPVLLLYVILQRYIIQNIATTGLKG
jgi:multiple sugar transport system permease protein